MKKSKRIWTTASTSMPCKWVHQTCEIVWSVIYLGCNKSIIITNCFVIQCFDTSFLALWSYEPMFCSRNNTGQTCKMAAYSWFWHPLWIGFPEQQPIRSFRSRTYIADPNPKYSKKDIIAQSHLYKIRSSLWTAKGSHCGTRRETNRHAAVFKMLAV